MILLSTATDENTSVYFIMAADAFVKIKEEKSSLHASTFKKYGKDILRELLGLKRSCPEAQEKSVVEFMKIIYPCPTSSHPVWKPSSDTPFVKLLRRKQCRPVYMRDNLRPGVHISYPAYRKFCFHKLLLR